MSFSWLDVKLAVRMLIKFPGLTAVSVFAMAVAIAVCAAFFEFTHDLSSATLPLDEGERLVGVVNWNVAVNEPERRSAADYFIWRNELTAVEDLGAYATVDRNLITADNYSEPVKVAEISAVGFRVASAAAPRPDAGVRRRAAGSGASGRHRLRDLAIAFRWGSVDSWSRRQAWR
jgi:hypothetical protein